MANAEAARFVLEAKDYITFAGLIITFVIGVAGLVVSWRTSRKNTYINTITSARIEWIQSLRNNISKLCSLAQGMKKEETNYNEINYTIEMVKLLLNPAEQESKTVVELLNSLPEAISKGKVYDHTSRILNSTQSILKNEWDRVKFEARNGA